MGHISFEINMRDVLTGKNPHAVALGRARSEKKAAASKENGKKGGRPKKPHQDKDK